MPWKWPTDGGTPEGLEQFPDTSGKSDDAPRSLASTIVTAAKNTDYTELSAVIEAWSALAPEVQQSILAMIRAAK